MWDIPKLYISACSKSVQLVPLHPIIISILFHHYKELNECISELERIEMKVYIKNKGLTIKEEEKEVPTTLHSCYFLDNEITES
jgi:hypothetical protein